MNSRSQLVQTFSAEVATPLFWDSLTETTTSMRRCDLISDTGMASAFLILRATELGFVAHPIAGFDEEKVKEALEIPDEMTVITLLIVGKRSEEPNPILSKKQIESERKRPSRHPLRKIMFMNRYVASE
ncbi:MAG: nitroreductase family protein [Candidatus Glassbacteria bacterium]